MYAAYNAAIYRLPCLQCSLIQHHSRGETLRCIMKSFINSSHSRHYETATGSFALALHQLFSRREIHTVTRDMILLQEQSETIDTFARYVLDISPFLFSFKYRAVLDIAIIARINPGEQEKERERAERSLILESGEKPVTLSRYEYLRVIYSRSRIRTWTAEAVAMEEPSDQPLWATVSHRSYAGLW